MNISQKLSVFILNKALFLSKLGLFMTGLAGWGVKKNLHVWMWYWILLVECGNSILFYNHDSGANW